MKILIPSIPEAGQAFDFDETTPWAKTLLAKGFSEVYLANAPVQIHIELRRTLQNIAVTGEIAITLYPTCASCGTTFSTVLKIPIHRNLVPFFEGPREEILTQAEEMELNAEDLEFSFYHEEEIDLATILSEEVFLAMPLRFLCKEACLGLCPRCGADLNVQPCDCSDIIQDSPFRVLQGLKIP